MSEKGATAGLTCCLMLKSTRCILRWEMVLLMAFAPFQGVLAQFDIVPTDSLVEVFGVDSITRVFQIDFPNASGDSLGLSWRWVDGGWTEGWDVNLCDLGECYTGVPADADMLPMGPEGAGFLKLIVNSLEIEGHCFLHFWVWPTGNQDALVLVYFELMNDAAVGISDALQSARTEFSVHPIPCPVGVFSTSRAALMDPMNCACNSSMPKARWSRAAWKAMEETGPLKPTGFPRGSTCSNSTNTSRPCGY